MKPLSVKSGPKEGVKQQQGRLKSKLNDKMHGAENVLLCRISFYFFYYPQIDFASIAELGNSLHCRKMQVFEGSWSMFCWETSLWMSHKCGHFYRTCSTLWQICVTKNIDKAKLIQKWAWEEKTLMYLRRCPNSVGCAFKSCFKKAINLKINRDYNTFFCLNAKYTQIYPITLDIFKPNTMIDSSEWQKQ